MAEKDKIEVTRQQIKEVLRFSKFQMSIKRMEDFQRS